MNRLLHKLCQNLLSGYVYRFKDFEIAQVKQLTPSFSVIYRIIQ